MADNPVERRLAAILAADVVGYSKMMGEDEAGTLSLIRALRTDLIEPKIAEHKGRLFKTMGDGFLAEFPSVVNAVACAVAIQKGVVARKADLRQDQRLELRIGVNVGDVIAEGDDLFGDGVNVAARLEGIGRPGDVVISGAVRDHLGNRLDLQFDDLGEHRLKNIGIPIRAYAIGVESVPRSSGPMAPATTKPSIAVLPFDNMSGDPGQQYISDGITEDLTTELARFSGLTVASRLAAFHYGGKGKSPIAAARELGVSYVVEGSVRVAGPRLRITAQLIDARTGKHTWADRYDRDSGDIFAVQDEVVAAIVAMLEGRMAASEAAAARAKPTSSWSAYDYFLQGRELCNRYREPEAIPLLAKAVAIDPGFAAAHAWLSSAMSLTNIYSSDPSSMDEADRIADLALELDANDAVSQWAKALSLFWRGHIDRARTYFERAMALNPGDIQIRGDYANWLRMCGQPARALEIVDRLLAQGPYVPEWFTYVRGAVLFDLGRYAEAAELLSVAPPHYLNALLYGAAAQAHLGNSAQAKKAIAALLQSRADLSVRKIVNFVRYKDAVVQEQFLEGIRKAGLPE